MSRFFKWSFYLPTGILLIGSVLFRLLPWDMEWADLMHSPDGGWDQDSTGFWKFLYDFGIVPAVLLVLGVFIFLMLGVGHPWRKYRKVLLYLISCLAIGPGLITNGILKEFWGRPRPKQVNDFGGIFPYEPLLVIDPISTGKSFPCGHATMGFFFFALGFAFLHRGKKWMLFGVVTGLILGGLIGYARLVQGGHFPSDTLWAAGVCWFTSLGLFYAYGLHKSPFLSREVKRERPWWVMPGMVAGIVVLMLTISLATPYEKTRKETYTDSKGVKQINAYLSGGYELIPRDGQIEVISRGDGHRFPKSRHSITLLRKNEILEIRMKKTGFFTELNLQNTIFYPPHLEVKIFRGNL